MASLSRLSVALTSVVAVLLLLLLLASCSPVSASVEQWKPRQMGPRSPSLANRHRFFLPNPCVLHDERTGADFDITSLRKTGSVDLGAHHFTR
jgi:hypothetical protein